jgi:hypothetical protein
MPKTRCGSRMVRAAEGGSVGGNDHAQHRRCGSLFTSCPLKQGPPHRPEAPAEAKGGLGNPRLASARRALTRPRSVQSGLDIKLKGCDLVRLQIQDVCVGGRVRDRATVIQRKTGRPVQFETTDKPEQQSAIGSPTAFQGTGSTSSRAGFMTGRTSRHDNTLGSSIVGSSARVSTARLTGPTHAADQGRADLREDRQSKGS